MKLALFRESLHPACRASKLDTVKLLLAQGVEVNARGFSGSCPDRCGGIPLVAAAAKGSLETITLLLHRGAQVDPPDADEEML